MAFIVINFNTQELRYLEEPVSEAMLKNMATFWDRFVATVQPAPGIEDKYFQFRADHILKVDQASIAYITDVYPQNAGGQKKQACMVYELDMKADALIAELHDEDWSKKDRAESLTNNLIKAKAFYDINSSGGVSVEQPAIQRFFRSDNIPTPSRQLINDIKIKLQKTHRTTLMRDMLNELEELDTTFKTPDQEETKAKRILSKYGCNAEQDHAKRSGWRWGGFVMGMFGARDKAPLMFSSNFKKTTDELGKNYQPKR
jgi:hypothetical protein